jgi:hypothetical protein
MMVAMVMLDYMVQEGVVQEGVVQEIVGPLEEVGSPMPHTILIMITSFTAGDNKWPVSFDFISCPIWNP